MSDTKFAEFVKSKKLDVRRILSASHLLETLHREDRGIRLAKAPGEDESRRTMQTHAKETRKPRSGRPSPDRALDRRAYGGQGCRPHEDSHLERGQSPPGAEERRTRSTSASSFRQETRLSARKRALRPSRAEARASRPKCDHGLRAPKAELNVGQARSASYFRHGCGLFASNGASSRERPSWSRPWAWLVRRASCGPGPGGSVRSCAPRLCSFVDTAILRLVVSASDDAAPGVSRSAERMRAPTNMTEEAAILAKAAAGDTDRVS
jgi:hypothetical protein